MNTQTPFRKRYTLQERTEKANRQMAANPGKLVIIVEKHPKSILPVLTNPRYIYQTFLGFYARRIINSV